MYGKTNEILMNDLLKKFIESVIVNFGVLLQCTLRSCERTSAQASLTRWPSLPADLLT